MVVYLGNLEFLTSYDTVISFTLIEKLLSTYIIKVILPTNFTCKVVISFVYVLYAYVISYLTQSDSL